MTDFRSVLSAAQHLPTDDRLRLIEALQQTVSADADLPIHPEWESELERRVAAVKDGSATMIPWSTIRDEALARIGHGDTR
jgi:putative addiction module component (TIGR02574 family)